MANLDSVIRDLEAERSDVQKQLERLDNAIRLLGSGGTGRRGGRRNLSAAARARIAAAQRKRWAAWKAKQK